MNTLPTAWLHGRVTFCLSLYRNESGEADSARGTSISTSTTFSALVGVDAVDVAFRDSANGALINAGSACNAVFANYVSHSVISLEIID